ncbi:unnamed protein product [Acanthosepion pharaonis]|uniref:Uncharacterized protein n=1 Tax=Acanthosepion pharaonis TaxID=158019 RepID=A0A812CA08_ACAPH|nr:unnamed protein product [Sepia pharaonis]
MTTPHPAISFLPNVLPQLFFFFPMPPACTSALPFYSSLLSSFSNLFFSIKSLTTPPLPTYLFSFRLYFSFLFRLSPLSLSQNYHTNSPNSRVTLKFLNDSIELLKRKIIPNPGTNFSEPPSTDTSSGKNKIFLLSINQAQGLWEEQNLRRLGRNRSNNGQWGEAQPPQPLPIFAPIPPSAQENSPHPLNSCSLFTDHI